MRRSILIAIVLCFTSAAALLFAEANTDRPSSAKEAFGDKVMTILATPTKIGAFRINSFIQAGPPSKLAAGYVITGDGKALDKAYAGRLGALLADDKSYEFREVAGCFDPGVAFRIYKDNESVDVAICYSCDGLVFVPDVSTGKRSPQVTIVAYNDLVKLAKEAFPNDAEIQGIKEHSKQ